MSIIFFHPSRRVISAIPISSSKMASSRSLLFLTCACALLLASQARPIEPVDGAEGRQLLQTDPCCALFKKTATDLTGFSGRAGQLAAALANILQALLQAGTVKQQMIDFTNQVSAGFYGTVLEEYA
jgi:hypothetical protein